MNYKGIFTASTLALATATAGCQSAQYEGSVLVGRAEPVTGYSRQPAYREPAYREPAYREPAYQRPSYRQSDGAAIANEIAGTLLGAAGISGSYTQSAGGGYYDDYGQSGGFRRGAPQGGCINVPSGGPHGGTDRICGDGYDSRRSGDGYPGSRYRQGPQEWQTCTNFSTGAMYPCPRN